METTENATPANTEATTQAPSELNETDVNRQGAAAAIEDPELMAILETYSLEAVVELKISRFLDQIGSFHPDNLHQLIIRKVEKPLLNQILKRTGGNQVHASRILGINRNTLRKKMKMYGFC